MIKVYANIKINRHHQEVFDYISNFENNPKWQGGMVDARVYIRRPFTERINL